MLRKAFTRRRALQAAVSAAGAGAAVRLTGVADATAATPHEHSPLVHGSMHSGFAQGRTTVDPETNGFDPTAILRDFDWGTERRLAGGKTLREWKLVAYDKEIEIVPGVKFASVDVQRPRSRADAPRTRRRPAAHPLRQRRQPPAHDPLPRDPPRRDGRRAGDRRGHRRRPDQRRRGVHVRVRRTAVRAASVPLPRLAARRTHRQGSVRRADRRPAGGTSAGRRALDGAERVRPELRRGQRGLRGQHRRLPVHVRARCRSSAASSCASTS